MKKIVLFSAAALCAASLFVSCGGNVKSSDLKTELDSLNYTFGAATGSQIHQYVLAQDTTDAAVDALIKGLEEGFNKEGENSQYYLRGLEIGASIKQQLKAGLMGDTALVANEKLVKGAIIQALKKEELINGEEAYQYFMSKVEALNEAKKVQEFSSVKEAGESFLATNATKEGVITTESGLQYEVIKAGKGAKPTITDRVKVHYHGTLLDGTVFDSSVERKEPAVFGVNQVIPGWTEALQLMTVGSKFKLYIPQQLAYGANGSRNIDPFSVLVFEVELLSIEK